MPDRPLSRDLTPGTKLRPIDGQRVVTLRQRKDPAEHLDHDAPWFPGWWLEGNEGGLADRVIDDENSQWEILG